MPRGQAVLRSPRRVISDSHSKISRVKVSRCPAGAARQGQCCGPRAFVHDDVYNHGCNQVPRGSALCSATLDGICVGDTGHTLLRSAHILHKASRGVAVATCFAQPRLMEFVCGVTGHTLLSSARHTFDQSMDVAMCSAQPHLMEFVWVTRGTLH